MQEHIVGNETLELPLPYTVVGNIYQDQFGAACTARDKETGKLVSIKKVDDLFYPLQNAKQALLELRILRHLQHDNVMSVSKIILDDVSQQFSSLFVFSQIMETDLDAVIKAEGALVEDQCLFFLYQILRGIKYVHSAAVVHTDLKPFNFLVNSQCSITICDFTWASFTCSNGTSYSHSRAACSPRKWYRAPETLCTWSSCSVAIDMWSIGCTFAEMLRGAPLFPGRDTSQMLEMIIQALGKPEDEFDMHALAPKARRMIDSFDDTPPISLETSLEKCAPEAVRCVRALLQIRPEKRETAEQALQQPYLKDLYCPSDEPTRSPLDSFDFEFMRTECSERVLREEFAVEALRYCPTEMRDHKQHMRKVCVNLTASFSSTGELKQVRGTGMSGEHLVEISDVDASQNFQQIEKTIKVQVGSRMTVPPLYVFCALGDGTVLSESHWHLSLKDIFCDGALLKSVPSDNDGRPPWLEWQLNN
eukprot:TRINITY_DN31662_c0_g1_i1.p1 TRINITY_DN31662_c0_g1~~TRINITY_DN31662_c0_g1_i1.p1  ORF type:complete len:477 (-),score=35.98 TRINITY_DN31662_c0_g1_i1:242-1672(-)